ncbi:serine/threonine-protein kinase [Wenjunlia tyrosinilytica]|uniref:non-specific serine/threonine protein kinase n=1 Tax=Wenjunlia tyrosinilytica TaxID=1544741 RepID=A0A917ZJX5_9ACTN|nr:serine/threonine-protein kinase [Wenjunlia tyrosinilytica]GGO83509.1 serine/threonine protein kinase [Wenjunlia tyrosinilytica]
MSDHERVVAGRYRLVERIGRGGMGTVWRAEDELLGRHVAVKKLHVPPHLSDEERGTLYERTRREARSAARITHPNVVVVHDVVEDDGLPCIVMEYVPSRTLGDVLKKDGPISQREAARIGRGMAAALRAAHRAGVLHRDVKPANVLLGTDSSHGGSGEDEQGRPDGRVVLTDFGIAVASGSSTLTRTGELVGSFDYLSPERIRGAGPGTASDLWALGATLYQALEGEAPFHRDTPIETAYAIAAEPFPPPRRAGVLTPLIKALLEKDPERRMTVEQLERQLAGSVDTVLVGHLSDTPAAPVPLPHPQEPQRPHATQLSQHTGSPPDDSAATSRHLDPPQGPPSHGEGDTGSQTVLAGRLRRGRTRGRSPAVTVAAVLLVTVLAGGGAALWSQRHDSANQASGGHSSNTPEASPSLPPVPAVPEGFRRVHDRLGFSVTVPQSWHRVERTSGQEVNYLSPDELMGLKFNVLDFAGDSSIEHWRAIEPDVQKKSPGYENLRMNETRYQGRPAAIWEFTWQGARRKWHAQDLGFTAEGQRGYAIYLSAPDARWRECVKYFRTAADSFRLDG